MPLAVTATLTLLLASTTATATAATATAPAAPAPQASAAAGARHKPQVVSHYVDINSAGRKELMTLPGIGAAEADAIVAHRPYLTKTELVTKGVLPTGPFLALKHQVVAMQKFKTVRGKPAPAKAGASTAAASGPKAP